MSVSKRFEALVAEFFDTAVAEIDTQFPEAPREFASESALHFAHASDLQIRLARTLARLDLPAERREVRLVLRGEPDRVVRFWFEDSTATLHVEPVVDEMSAAPRSSLLIKQPLAPEHFTNIADAGVQMLIDSFGATYGAKIEVEAPLAPEFDEEAVMALLGARVRPDPDDGYRPGEECDPDFTVLYDAIQGVLRPIATESAFTNPPGDYFLVDYDNGHRQQKIEIENYSLLDPDVIHALRALLDRFPRWEIVVGLGEPDWPPMGLTIRWHEIIDGLLREYLPAECRGFEYRDARPGTESD